MCSKIQNQSPNTQPEIKRDTDQTTVMEEAKKMAMKAREDWASHHFMGCILKYFRSEPRNLKKIYDQANKAIDHKTVVIKENNQKFFTAANLFAICNYVNSVYSGIAKRISETKLTKNEYKELNGIRKDLENKERISNENINKMYLAVTKQMANTKIDSDEYKQLKEMRKDFEETKKITQKNIIQAYKKECQFKKVDKINDKINGMVVEYSGVIKSSIGTGSTMPNKRSANFSINGSMLDFIKAMGCDFYLYSINEDDSLSLEVIEKNLDLKNKGINLKGIVNINSILKDSKRTFNNNTLVLGTEPSLSGKKGAHIIKVSPFEQRVGKVSSH